MSTSSSSAPAAAGPSGTVAPIPRAAGGPSIDRHNVEIYRNRAAWERKERLRDVYAEFYRMIAAELAPGVPGITLELGSGLGNIKQHIPSCVTSDVFPNPWLDRQENAYALSPPDGSVANLVLFDVWHHLRFPGPALREFHRALAPGGRVILFEPAASRCGRLVYDFFHHEPVALHEPITWEPPPGFSADDADYYAAQGSATRIFWWGEHRARLTGWRVAVVRPVISFAYLASGGFSGPQIGGKTLHRLLGKIDRLAARWPRIFAVRLLVVLEKIPAPAP